MKVVNMPNRNMFVRFAKKCKQVHNFSYITKNRFGKFKKVYYFQKTAPLSLFDYIKDDVKTNLIKQEYSKNYNEEFEAIENKVFLSLQNKPLSDMPSDQLLSVKRKYLKELILGYEQALFNYSLYFNDAFTKEKIDSLKQIEGYSLLFSEVKHNPKFLEDILHLLETKQKHEIEETDVITSVAKSIYTNYHYNLDYNLKSGFAKQTAKREAQVFVENLLKYGNALSKDKVNSKFNNIHKVFERNLTLEERVLDMNQSTNLSNFVSNLNHIVNKKMETFKKDLYGTTATHLARSLFKDIEVSDDVLTLRSSLRFYSIDLAVQEYKLEVKTILSNIVKINKLENDITKIILVNSKFKKPVFETADKLEKLDILKTINEVLFNQIQSFETQKAIKNVLGSALSNFLTLNETYSRQLKKDNPNNYDIYINNISSIKMNINGRRYSELCKLYNNFIVINELITNIIKRTKLVSVEFVLSINNLIYEISGELQEEIENTHGRINEVLDNYSHNEVLLKQFIKIFISTIIKEIIYEESAKVKLNLINCYAFTLTERGIISGNDELIRVVENIAMRNNSRYVPITQEAKNERPIYDYKKYKMVNLYGKYLSSSLGISFADIKNIHSYKEKEIIGEVPQQYDFSNENTHYNNVELNKSANTIPSVEQKNEFSRVEKAQDSPNHSQDSQTFYSNIQNDSLQTPSANDNLQDNDTNAQTNVDNSQNIDGKALEDNEDANINDNFLQTEEDSAQPPIEQTFPTTFNDIFKNIQDNLLRKLDQDFNAQLSKYKNENTEDIARTASQDVVSDVKKTVQPQSQNIESNALTDLEDINIHNNNKSIEIATSEFADSSNEFNGEDIKRDIDYIDEKVEDKIAQSAKLDTQENDLLLEKSTTSDELINSKISQTLSDLATLSTLKPREGLTVKQTAEQSLDIEEHNEIENIQKFQESEENITSLDSYNDSISSETAVFNDNADKTNNNDTLNNSDSIDNENLYSADRRDDTDNDNKNSGYIYNNANNDDNGKIINSKVLAEIMSINDQLTDDDEQKIIKANETGENSGLGRFSKRSKHVPRAYNLDEEAQFNACKNDIFWKLQLRSIIKKFKLEEALNDESMEEFNTLAPILKLFEIAGGDNLLLSDITLDKLGQLTYQQLARLSIFKYKEGKLGNEKTKNLITYIFLNSINYSKTQEYKNLLNRFLQRKDVAMVLRQGIISLDDIIEQELETESELLTLFNTILEKTAPNLVLGTKKILEKSKFDDIIV